MVKEIVLRASTSIEDSSIMRERKVSVYVFLYTWSNNTVEMRSRRVHEPLVYTATQRVGSGPENLLKDMVGVLAGTDSYGLDAQYLYHS
jgi:hypothetical protein